MIIITKLKTKLRVAEVEKSNKDGTYLFSIINLTRLTTLNCSIST